MEPFKEASEKLEQDKVVTLPLVLMYYTKLKKHLTADSTDSPVVCQLKSRTLEFLQIKLPIEELHKVATFLWPPFRHLRVLDEQERKSVHDRVRVRFMTEYGCVCHKEKRAQIILIMNPQRSVRPLTNLRSGAMLRKLNQPTVILTVTFGTVTRVRTLKNSLNSGKPIVGNTVGFHFLQKKYFASHPRAPAANAILVQLGTYSKTGGPA